MPDEGITVLGAGLVPVTPDVLVARFGAEVTAESVQAALDRCSSALAKMNGVLKAAEIAAKDRQTAGARVYQAYDGNGSPRGWTASQQLTARLRDLGTAGDLISSVIGAAGDAARLHDLSFTVDDPAEARNAARDLAYADAKAKAERYAHLAGRRLGPVEAIRESDGGGSSPMPGGARMMAFGGAAPPVEAGELEISASVEVRWGLLS
ncbi:SIMPL domain-containing protein [Longispora albida]|uniref:SIMPL domain-containing protein n=1 Tax=Longispora albida TaxID=203523 RepID=UPI00037B66D9|nr:SIMPL domain-containing protein [Longispora albida]